MAARHLRKKDISDYYKGRSDILLDDAEKLFCHPQVLGSIDGKFNDGLKLCNYLLLETLGAEKAWSLIRQFIVIGNPKESVCIGIGLIFRKAYKDSLDTEPSEGIVTRTDVGNEIFKPLMQHCILTKRKHAQKFCTILRHATIGRDENMSGMLFQVSGPIIWRYLNAINSDVRIGAYFVQLNVFPPSSSDPITALDHFNRHCDAFVQALDDKSVDICLQAIEGVCEVISLYYEQIPEPHVETILNKLAVLAKDEMHELRAAIFRGLRYFCKCPRGMKKFEVLLRNICKFAIDDPIERVRCNVFRLLIMLADTRIMVILPPKATSEVEPILNLEDVLYRLDYEQSEAIEAEISKLLYLNLFNKNMSSEDRYRIVNGMCRLNRAASLDFHRLLNAIGVTTGSNVLAHMRSVLTVCSRAFKRLEEIKSRMSDSQEETSQEESSQDDTAMEVQDQATSERDELDKQLDRFRDVVCCMVVCFSTVRCAPGFDANNVDSQMISRSLSEIAGGIITYFKDDVNLFDVALTIIALIRNAGVHAAKLKNDCSKMLRTGVLNKRYLEIFGLIDMSELLMLLDKGLRQLSESIDKENRPVSKNRREEFTKKEIAVDALMELMNLPTCSQYVITKHMYNVNNFIQILGEICNNFVENLQIGRKFDSNREKIFYSCWKAWSVLLILRFNEDVFDEKKGADKVKRTPNVARRRKSDVMLERIELSTRSDPMVREYDWIKQCVSDYPPLSANADLVEHFYQAMDLHFRSYKHYKQDLEEVISYIKELHNMENEHPRGRSINQWFKVCMKSAEHALEYAVESGNEP